MRSGFGRTVSTLGFHLRRMQSVIFLSFMGPLFAGSTGPMEAQIQNALIRHGFENVAVCEDGSRVIIAYENRVYRFEARAILEVLKLAVQSAPSQANYVLIPQNRAVPLVAVLIDSSACRRIMRNRTGRQESLRGLMVQLDIQPYWRKLLDRNRLHLSSMKLDIFIHPQVKAQFGSPNDAVESQFNFAPSASMTMWKGMSISAQWIFPVQNEMDYEGDHARPGLLTLNQTLRLPSDVFVSGTAGYFTEHRYGGDLEVKIFRKNGRWAAGMKVGYTGFAAYLKNVWYYSGLSDWNAAADVETRLPSLDLVLRMSCGKFLYGDNGFRLDAFRQFGETGIGFFAVYTDGGRNGGFRLSLPVFPAKRMSPRRIRISPALTFPWSYRYRGLPVYGMEYETENRIDSFMKNLNPDYIRRQLLELSESGSGNEDGSTKIE